MTDLYIGDIKCTLETANELAYYFSQGRSPLYPHKLLFEKAYHTAIKVDPKPTYPEECWIITNQYDPNVREGNKL